MSVVWIGSSSFIIISFSYTFLPPWNMKRINMIDFPYTANRFFLSRTSCTLFVSPVCDSNFNKDLSAQRALFIEIMSFQQNAFFFRYARRDIYLKCKFLDRMQQNWRSLAVDARFLYLFSYWSECALIWTSPKIILIEADKNSLMLLYYAQINCNKYKFKDKNGNDTVVPCEETHFHVYKCSVHIRAHIW